MHKKDPKKSVDTISLLFSKFVLPIILIFIFVNLSENSKPILGILYDFPLLHNLTSITVSVIFRALACLVGAYLFQNIINLLLWDLLLLKRYKFKTPKLLKQISDFIIYFLAVSIILNTIFKLKVSDIITASGVIGIVLGVAVRPILTDLFAGIALNLEGAFVIDEYVLIRQKDIVTIGCIKEVTWRTTRVLTHENEYVIIPNSELLVSNVSNLTVPAYKNEFELEICIDYSSDIDLAQKVLNAALCEAISEGGPLAFPKPNARIKAIDASGVHFKITYSIDLSLRSKAQVANIVYKSIIKHFRFSGITPAASKSEISLGKISNQRNYDYKSVAHKKLIVGQSDFFLNLSDEEVSIIAEDLFVYELEAGDIVTTKGASGDSMFILVVGFLDVFLNDDSEPLNKVANIYPGQVFGEMSLLTGNPRNATITCAVPSIIYEISKGAISKLFNMHPELVDELSKIAAERQLKNSKEPNCINSTEEKEGLIFKISQSIRGFFRL